jgi:hypothetical protein
LAAGGTAAILCCIEVLGCRVSPARLENVVDADISGGDGLPARVIVDAWLWGSPAVGDAAGADKDTGRTGPIDGGTEVVDGAGLVRDGDAVPAGVGCGLLDGASCPVNQGCYADEALSGGTACRPATPGFGGGSRFPCQLQNDCSAGEACIDLKGSGKICLGLCRTAMDGTGGAPLGSATAGCLDLLASICVPLASYPGVGYCM